MTKIECRTITHNNKTTNNHSVSWSINCKLSSNTHTHIHTLHIHTYNRFKTRNSMCHVANGEQTPNYSHYQQPSVSNQSSKPNIFSCCIASDATLLHQLLVKDSCHLLPPVHQTHTLGWTVAPRTYWSYFSHEQYHFHQSIINKYKYIINNKYEAVFMPSHEHQYIKHRYVKVRLYLLWIKIFFISTDHQTTTHTYEEERSISVSIHLSVVWTNSNYIQRLLIFPRACLIGSSNFATLTLRPSRGRGQYFSRLL